MKKLVSILVVMAICSYSFCQVKVISNGNVGIGVSNPTYKLQVASSVLDNYSGI